MTLVELWWSNPGVVLRKKTFMWLCAVNEDVFVCNVYVICKVFVLFGFHLVRLFKDCNAQNIFGKRVLLDTHFLQTV